MTRAELLVQRQALRKLLNPLESIVMSCEHCAHFEGSWCRKFDGEPPADAVKVDIQCAEWMHDDIPF